MVPEDKVNNDCKISKYPGAKNNSGLLQFLINNIPSHNRYFELFFGSGRLFHTKRPAHLNLLNDINSDCIARYGETSITNVEFSCKPALSVLASTDFNRCDFIYLDPPYPFDSRRSGANYYKFEMTVTDHIQLLSSIRSLDVNIMISTKENELYNEELKGWRKLVFDTVDRKGRYQEQIFMNYDVPELLHQYDKLGADCWDRQRISRKVARFYSKIAVLPAYEKHLLIEALINNDFAAVQHFMSVYPGIDKNNCDLTQPCKSS